MPLSGITAPNLDEYIYALPEDRIALHPLAQRDAAKLLVYKNGNIAHRHFTDLPEELPDDAIVLFNDTKVIRARLFFRRENLSGEAGAQIEILCLEPLKPYTEMGLAMQATSGVVWECMAGNQKRWKKDETIRLELPGKLTLFAKLLEKKGRLAEVKFTWEPANLRWAEVLELAGHIPLPPYIHRADAPEDAADYQTVYSAHPGAVAAPTAGLHFSEAVLKEMDAKGIERLSLTLHVGAGTFQPVEETDVLNHPMHREQILFTKDFIQSLANNKRRKIIAAGTTSLRAVESLYWFGVQVINDKSISDFFIPKLYPYGLTPAIFSGNEHRSAPLLKERGKSELGNSYLPSASDSFKTILQWMEKRKLNELHGYTEIFIFPGYLFRVCDGLITNFHQPGSTLLMLVSAFIGGDWKKVYEEALQNNYRFLSYGDGSLLMRPTPS